MAADENARKSSAVRASPQARSSDDSREALRRLAPEDGHKHPSTGRIERLSTYADQANQYLILIEGGPPSNYSAWSPDLPGCVATGLTIDECETEMREAIAFHIDGLADDGGPIPEGSGPGVYVERTPRPAA